MNFESRMKKLIDWRANNVSVEEVLTMLAEIMKVIEEEAPNDYARCRAALVRVTEAHAEKSMRKITLADADRKGWAALRAAVPQRYGGN